MEYFPSPDHLRHASHPLDKDHTSGRRRESFFPFSTTFDPDPSRTSPGLRTGHQQEPREDQGRTPHKDTNNQPQKRRKKGPEKAEERPGEAQTGQTSRTPQNPKERPEKGHQRPPETHHQASRRRRGQPATSQPQERPGKAHGRPRTGPAVQNHRPTAKAKERPKKGQRKGHHGRPTPCRLWLPCRRVSNG